jgi:3-oxoacyl-[acyl-carrier protein] reductase/meso-butanediol dehydrogenase/(S,S)-butanediol dehydrogenase/diacetyl reductase
MTVAIAGGTRGMGAAIASAFAERGDKVIVGSRTEPEQGFLPKGVRFVSVDVRAPDQLAAFVEDAVASSGCLDVMVNCAGVSSWRPLSEIDESFWDFLIETNLKGTLFGCKAAAARMTPGGSIINISSLAGKRGSANNAVYCASKFGVNGITQSLAKELGPRGIRVNAVCPVYIRTDGLLEALNDPSAPPSGQPVETYLEQFALAQAALQRMPTGREVADMCLFLASSAASAVTGQCVNVDCGVLPG